MPTPHTFLSALYRLSHRWGLMNLLTLYWLAWAVYASQSSICPSPVRTHFMQIDAAFFFPLAWMLFFAFVCFCETQLALKFQSIRKPAQLLLLICWICLGNLAGLLVVIPKVRESPYFILYTLFLILSLGFKFVLGPLLGYLLKVKLPEGSNAVHLWGVGGIFLLFLSLLSSPNAVGSHCDPHRNSSVKANMHTMQTMFETYGVDWGGSFPATFRQIETEARMANNPYWKDFYQPYTDFASQPAQTDFNPKVGIPRRPKPIVWAGLYFGHAPDLSVDKRYPPGQVIFEAFSETQYFLYGSDRDGYIIEEKNEPFVLSNS